MAPSNAPSISDDADADRGAVKSLVKALDILEAAARATVPPRIADVAIASGISRPTAYRIVQTLVAKGYLSQDAQSGRLSPGYSLLMLSAGLLDRSRLRIEALPHLQELANLTGERTNLGILHRNKVLYLAGVEKPSLPTIYSRFGKSAPAHCCSLGKAILAFLTPQELQELLAAEPLRPETPNSITSMPRFLEELELTRQRGYAIDEGEHQEGACCVATTIFSQGRAIGSIGVSGAKLAPILEHVPVLRHTAELISHVL
jgi:DNA-binding IclR family transcriptional regulator